jgi:hypothetical protein
VPAVFVIGCATRGASDDAGAGLRSDLWRPAPPATLSEGELALLDRDASLVVDGVDHCFARNDARLGIGTARMVAPAATAQVVVRDIVRRDRINSGRSWNDDRVTTRIRERVER